MQLRDTLKIGGDVRLIGTSAQSAGLQQSRGDAGRIPPMGCRPEAMQVDIDGCFFRRVGTKRLRTAKKTLTKRCNAPAERNRCITRSLRSGRCEFSARLFKPFCDRCSISGMTRRLAAPYERSLSVTMRLGWHPCIFINRTITRFAALVLRRACTISSVDNRRGPRHARAVFPPADRHDHLIQMPHVSRAGRFPPQAGGIVAAIVHHG